MVRRLFHVSGIVRSPLRVCALLACTSGFLVACGDDTFERPDRGGAPGFPDIGSTDGTSPGEDDAGNPLDASAEPDGTGSDAEPVPDQVLQDWQTLCSGCHGERGEGGIGPVLAGIDRTFEQLRDAIDTRMPPADPSLCVGECAENLARWILALSDTPEPVDCTEAATPSARVLRLLTRREYNATIRTLFGDAATACTSDADCDWRTAQCGDSVCVPNPCGEIVFAWNPRGTTARTVHVAGSFNGWPGTISAGGLQMNWQADIGYWVARASLSGDAHQYKFVVDETTWFVDPEAESSVDDGFGGQNSVITLNCDAGGDGGSAFNRDWTARVPEEVRPQHYFFDAHSTASLVTATHAEEYLGAAEDLGELVASRIDSIHPCNWSGDRAGCFASFVAEWSPRVYRRPVTPDEQARLVEFGLAGSADGRADVQWLVTAMFSSPHFLYRSELGEEQGGGSFRLRPWEIASWLSYTFWGTMPDDELLAAASGDGLDSANEWEAQARRLLADPRARDRVGTFAEQWLGIERILSATRSTALFPEFTDDVRAAMRAETRRFVQHVVFDSTGSFAELYGADYTFANAALARVYALTGITSDALTRVSYPDGSRSGVLGHGSVMTATAHSDQTSPIRRGLFVRERLLCQEFPAPPANAGGVPDVDPTATTRERFRQHTDDPTCYSCHQFIDDVGFGFERFDPIGAPRDEENGLPIDSQGAIRDIEGFGTGTETTFTDLAGLGDALSASDEARQCVVRQYWRFAHGHQESASEECAIEWLDAALVEANGDLIEMMVALTQEPTFALRTEAP